MRFAPSRYVDVPGRDAVARLTSSGLAAAALSGRAPPTFSEGRRADPVQELRRVPPADRDGADVAASPTTMRGRGRARSSRRSSAREMPPWGADPHVGKFAERPEPERGRDRHHRRVGRWRLRRKATAPTCRRRRSSRKAGRSASRISSSRCEAVQRARRRHRAVHLRHDPDQSEGRHLDQRRRAAADRSPRRPPHHQRPRRRQRHSRRPKPRLTRDRDAQGNRGGLGGYVPGRLDSEFDEGVGAEDSGRRRHRAADALHDDWPAGDRPDRRSACARQGAADQAARRRAAARCRTRRSRFRPGDPNYEVTAKQTFDRDTYLSTPVSAHARARQGRHLHGDLSGRPRRSVAARAEVRLQLAVELQARRAEVAAEGIDADGRRALRQLDGQPLQPRSDRRPCGGAIRRGKRCCIGYYGTIEMPARRAGAFIGGETEQQAASAWRRFRPGQSACLTRASDRAAAGLGRARSSARGTGRRGSVRQPLRDAATPATIRASPTVAVAAAAAARSNRRRARPAVDAPAGRRADRPPSAAPSPNSLAAGAVGAAIRDRPASAAARRPVAAFDPVARRRRGPAGGRTSRTRDFNRPRRPGSPPSTVPKLTLKWAFGFPNATSARAQPTVAGGRVFVGSQNGTVYALDAKTGCTIWTFKAKAGVRTAIVHRHAIAACAGSPRTSATAARMSTRSTRRPARNSGRSNVETHPSAHVTGAPTLYQNRLYVPVASGEEGQGGNAELRVLHVPRQPRRARRRERRAGLEDLHHCRRSRSRSARTRGGADAVGTVRRGHLGVADRRRQTPRRLRGDRQHVHRAAADDERRGHGVRSRHRQDRMDGTGHAEGRLRRRLQSAATRANCPRTTIGTGFRFRQLADPRARCRTAAICIVIGQKSGVGWALDPDKQGAVVWQYRAGKGSALGGMEFGSAVRRRERLLPGGGRQRRRTPGELHAVRLSTGERRGWRRPQPVKCGARGRGCTPAHSGRASPSIPGVVFVGANDGGVRAYSTKDGIDPLGVRHQPRVHDRQRRGGEGRVDQRPRSRRRRRHALHELRLRRARRTARQRAARVRPRIAAVEQLYLLLVKCPAPRRRNGPPSTENSSVMSNALSDRIENTRRS